MKLMKQNEIKAGATCIRLGTRQAQSLAIRNVAIVMMAAKEDPVKKKALNREPSRARSFGCASSASSAWTTVRFDHLPLIRLDAPTMPGVMPIPMMTRDTINIAVF